MKLKSKTTGTKVGLADEDTIFIKSHKNINIIAKEEILLKAKVINIDAKEELNLIKGDALSGTVESSITQSTEIDKKAKEKTKIAGRVKEQYPQIQDAPPEEKFDGAKVFTNVVAGLAVVGLVTIATAAIVVATGGSAAIIAGAALGGTISVGMTALFDKINNRVSSISEYMFNGFTGAVTGAISGGIDKAKKLGEGAKLAREALLGLGIGTGEDAARQVLLEGKKEVDPIRSVINGIMNAGLAIAVPVLIKGGKAVVNKIKTPGVNKSVGEVATKEVATKEGEALVNKTGESISEEAGKFTTKLVKKSTCTQNELYNYLLKNSSADDAKKFVDNGIWPEGTPIPKSSSVLNPDGSIDWSKAPQGGYTLRADGTADKKSYIPYIGDVIDRYGKPDGRYTSPVVDGRAYSYSERSLPYIEDLSSYHQYKVIGDFSKIDDYINNCPDTQLKAKIDAMVTKYYDGDYSKLNVYKGTVAKVEGWGSGGAIQDEFPIAVEQLIKIRLLEELK